MTMLLLRTFQARPGSERELLGSLRRMAAATLSARAEAVLICQHRNALEHFVWLEHARRSEAARPVHAAPLAPELGKEISPAREIEFLGGFYRFPLPRCQVWSVHLQQSGPRLFTITKELMRLARISPRDSSVLGLSLYGAVGLPAGLFGFLALTPGHTPADILAGRRGDQTPDFLGRAEWRALQVCWTRGRIDSEAAPCAISPSRYPRAAFWARSPAASGASVEPAPHRSQMDRVREVDI